MHSRQLQCTVESFIAQQKALLHNKKFCCIAEKSILWQKLEKSSFCSRNWRKVPFAVETGEKFILQQKQRISLLCSVFPWTLDSTFAHKLAVAKWYFGAHFVKHEAQLSSLKKKRKKNPRQYYCTIILLFLSLSKYIIIW